MLRRQPVADADHRQPGVLRQALQAEVLHVIVAERPAAAMDVQERSRRFTGRRDHTQSDQTTRTLDLDRSRVGDEHRRGVEPGALAPLAPGLLGRLGVNRGHSAEQAFELGVECACLRQQLRVVGHLCATT